MTIKIAPLTPEYFAAVIALGELVHGENYLNPDYLEAIYKKSQKNGVNCSLIALDGDKVVGFRLTYAHGQWPVDQWCTTEEWQVPADSVCYFKSNTLNPEYQGQGLGSKLLNASIQAAKQQGARAGLAHIWLGAPGNSAFKYFEKNGGRLVKTHPNRWTAESHQTGYDCVSCGFPCVCEAGEMILYFE